ncbi:MAG: hypothetical protein ACUVX8_19125 [Candidatus Zipacnadales bacterium]
MAIMMALAIGLSVYLIRQAKKGPTSEGSGLQITAPEEQIVEGERDEMLPKEEVVGASLATEHYSLTVPAGWERSREDEPDETDLVLKRSLGDGKQLVFAVLINLLNEPMELSEYGDKVIETLDVELDSDDPDAELYGEKGRMVTYNKGASDNVLFMTVRKGFGLNIHMVAPKGTMRECAAAFDEILETFVIEG